MLIEKLKQKIQLTANNKVVAAGACLLLAFAAGRYSLPERIRVETKTVQIENKSEQVQTGIDKDRHKETKITEVTRPDGTREKTTQVIEDTNTSKKTNKHSSDQIELAQSKSKEITYAQAKVTISALMGVPVSFSGLGPLQYGGSVTKPILGPVTVGIFGLSSGVAGFSLGLTF